MNNIKTFEGFFKKEKKIDTETANGILDRLNSLVELDVEKLPNGGGYSIFYTKYSFIMDGFNIKVNSLEGPARIPGTSIPIASDGGTKYQILVDDVKLDIGYLLAKKIYKRVKYFYDKPSDDNKYHIKKDAHINFRNHN